MNGLKVGAVCTALATLFVCSALSSVTPTHGVGLVLGAALVLFIGWSGIKVVRTLWKAGKK